MKYILLNTSILSTFGSFKYEPASLLYIKSLLKETIVTGVGVLSAIGHEGTAELLSLLLERDVPVNRIASEQNVGDIGIVFKLNGRPKEGQILTLDEANSIGYQFGLLTKLE